MRLNHLNLAVNDVSAASQFFVQHFGLSVKKEITGKFVILEDEDGFALILGRIKPDAVSYPDFLDFHVGFKRRGSSSVWTRIRSPNQGLINSGKVFPHTS